MDSHGVAVPPSVAWHAADASVRCRSVGTAIRSTRVAAMPGLARRKTIEPGHGTIEGFHVGGVAIEAIDAFQQRFT